MGAPLRGLRGQPTWPWSRKEGAASSVATVPVTQSPALTYQLRLELVAAFWRRRRRNCQSSSLERVSLLSRSSSSSTSAWKSCAGTAGGRGGAAWSGCASYG
jgi:hypothetical protein